MSGLVMISCPVCGRRMASTTERVPQHGEEGATCCGSGWLGATALRDPVTIEKEDLARLVNGFRRDMDTGVYEYSSYPSEDELAFYVAMSRTAGLEVSDDDMSHLKRPSKSLAERLMTPYPLLGL